MVDFLEGEEGLNLTWEVRDGILTHTGQRKPATLEGQLVRVCDRIAYINHDIDDALRGGILKFEQLPAEEIAYLGKTGSERLNTMIRDLIKNSWDRPQISLSKDLGEITESLRKFYFKMFMSGLPPKVKSKGPNLLLERFITTTWKNPRCCLRKSEDRWKGMACSVLFAIIFPA